jgi:hypothetical protein
VLHRALRALFSSPPSLDHISVKLVEKAEKPTSDSDKAASNDHHLMVHCTDSMYYSASEFMLSKPLCVLPRCESARTGNELLPRQSARQSADAPLLSIMTTIIPSADMTPGRRKRVEEARCSALLAVLRQCQV